MIGMFPPWAPELTSFLASVGNCLGTLVSAEGQCIQGAYITSSCKLSSPLPIQIALSQSNKGHQPFKEVLMDPAFPQVLKLTVGHGSHEE